MILHSTDMCRPMDRLLHVYVCVCVWSHLRRNNYQNINLHLCVVFNFSFQNDFIADLCLLRQNCHKWSNGHFYEWCILLPCVIILLIFLVLEFFFLSFKRLTFMKGTLLQPMEYWLQIGLFTYFLKEKVLLKHFASTEWFKLNPCRFWLHCLHWFSNENFQYIKTQTAHSIVVCR